MKIDFAIVSSNNDPYYLDFWEPVRKLWYNKFKIKPILVLIGEENRIIDTDEYIIHELKKIENISLGFQAQISRMYITKYYLDKICITSDIDMLPLSKEYFVDTLIPYEEDSFVIMSSDAYNENRFPICYNVSKGIHFYNLLNLNMTFEEYVNKLHALGKGWDTDELYFSEKVFKNINTTKFIFLKRGWINGIANKRIDRVQWNYNLELIKNDYYIDSHSVRPYTQNKNEIDEIINNSVNV